MVCSSCQSPDWCVRGQDQEGKGKESVADLKANNGAYACKDVDKNSAWCSNISAGTNHCGPCLQINVIWVRKWGNMGYKKCNMSYLYMEVVTSPLHAKRCQQQL
jgi:hypothetical protein